MSWSEGRTWSSQNLMYSRVSPADLENSTTATSGARSKTSMVMASLPFLPWVGPCILTMKSFLPVTLKLSFFPMASSLGMRAEAECLDMNMEGDLLRVSNKFLRSKPLESEEIISKAL
uniref:Uncharacterized protein n=1 Tax=Cajanus cajan TaxID=3821 RepID=A0A151S6K3_CAJCA|nr:hypothetical protein KK1_027811 [Cajanus cajan]